MTGCQRVFELKMFVHVTLERTLPYFAVGMFHQRGMKVALGDIDLFAFAIFGGRKFKICIDQHAGAVACACQVHVLLPVISGEAASSSVTSFSPDVGGVGRRRPVRNLLSK